MGNDASANNIGPCPAKPRGWRQAAALPASAPVSPACLHSLPMVAVPEIALEEEDPHIRSVPFRSHPFELEAKNKET